MKASELDVLLRGLKQINRKELQPILDRLTALEADNLALRGALKAVQDRLDSANLSAGATAAEFARRYDALN